jgi:hypothetical protein
MTVLELIAALRDALPYRDPGQTIVSISTQTHDFRIDAVTRELGHVCIRVTAVDGPGDDDAVAPEVASDRD